MKEKYLKIKNLSVSENLANFINRELIGGCWYYTINGIIAERNNV